MKFKYQAKTKEGVTQVGFVEAARPRFGERDPREPRSFCAECRRGAAAEHAR